MENKTVISADAHFGFRSDTLKRWQELNPVLCRGEPGVVTGLEAVGDGLTEESERIKFGDGGTPWNDLPWWKGPKGEKGETGEQGAKGDTGDIGPQGPQGEPGQDYVLNDADKQEIANMTKPIIDEAISLKADVEFKAFDTDFSLVDGSDGVHIEPFTRIGPSDFLFFGENKVVMEPFDYSYLTAFNVGDIYRITIANQQVVSVEKILKIADVDAQLGKIERRYFGPIIPVYDNVTYYATNEISDIEIVYPEGDFICSLTFTTAAEGDITIYLPESKYIGGVPTFGNGETWELNIKNGVVVGGLIE